MKRATVALGAPRDLADEPHRLELVEEVSRVLVDVQHPADGFAGRDLPRRSMALALLIFRL